MFMKSLAAALIGASLIAAPALAQSSDTKAPPAKSDATQQKAAPAKTDEKAAPAKSAATKNEQNASATGEWQGSELIGLNVYNGQNEKIGDIKELMVNKEGRIDTVVIAVGGFLGMGEHDVAVKFSELKWQDEPVRSTTSSRPARPVRRPPARADRHQQQHLGQAQLPGSRGPRFQQGSAEVDAAVQLQQVKPGFGLQADEGRSDAAAPRRLPICDETR